MIVMTCGARVTEAIGLALFGHQKVWLETVMLSAKQDK